MYHDPVTRAEIRKGPFEDLCNAEVQRFYQLMLLRSVRLSVSTMSSSSSSAAAGFATLAINHDASKQKFFVTLPTTTAEALLEYDIVKPSAASTSKEILDVLHTFSPPEARGQGLAARLADAAFKYAREKGMVVRPSCSYISGNYLKKAEGEASKWTFDTSSNIAAPKIE